MAGCAAKTFTLQLNSSSAEQTSAAEERYQVGLTPAIDVPYMARPRAQLSSTLLRTSARASATRR